MYKTVLVADFLEPDQCVGKTATAADSSTNTILDMHRKTTNAFLDIGGNGTNAILDMGSRPTKALSSMHGRATNTLSSMPATAVPPTRLRNGANGMRHHAG
jgi:hypothetical protein